MNGAKATAIAEVLLGLCEPRKHTNLFLDPDLIRGIRTRKNGVSRMIEDLNHETRLAMFSDLVEMLTSRS